jgi:UTP--glucose-1-phosphate uridylyltransferase
MSLKAVIPVAGLGMHMLPATKAIPKEMLPIVDKPMVQYIVDEIVAAGIKDIVLVTHSSKNAVENHFDTSYELEALLEQRVKRQLLAEVQAICPPGVTIMNVRQGAAGLGHSILCARPIIGDNPFVVVLPDIILMTPAPIRCAITLPRWWRVSTKRAVARFWQNVWKAISPSTPLFRLKMYWNLPGRLHASLSLSKNRMSRRRWSPI